MRWPGDRGVQSTVHCNLAIIWTINGVYLLVTELSKAGRMSMRCIILPGCIMWLLVSIIIYNLHIIRIKILFTDDADWIDVFRSFSVNWNMNEKSKGNEPIPIPKRSCVMHFLNDNTDCQHGTKNVTDFIIHTRRLKNLRTQYNLHDSARHPAKCSQSAHLDELNSWKNDKTFLNR